MKRQRIAVIFLLIWLMAGSLPALLLLEGKRQARQEFALFKNHYKNTSTSSFQFSDSEYKSKLENKEEIRIENQLFDIISVKKTIHGVYVTCIPDSYENKIEMAFVDWNSNKSKKNNAGIIKTFNPDLKIINGQPELVLPFIFCAKPGNKFVYTAKSVYLSKANPPPEFIHLQFA